MSRAANSLVGVAECSHPDHKTYGLDYSQLWHGAPAQIFGHGADRWKGGFRGRPMLADALWPSLSAWLKGKAPEAFRRTLYALREFWRFLDGYERAGFGPIDALSDLTGELGVLWLRPNSPWPRVSRKSAYVFIGTLIRLSRREMQGSGDVFLWPPFWSSNSLEPKDLPSEQGVRNALSLLKDATYAIYRRWQRADSLAADGRDLTKLTPGELRSMAHLGHLTEADAHTTYRKIVEESGNALASTEEVGKAFGLQCYTALPWWWPCHAGKSGSPNGKKVSIRELQSGLYPTVEDVDTLSQLFIARTGWNPGTVLNLDTTNDSWARRHGDISADLWIIEALKDRGQTWQWTVFLGRLTTGPYQIVKTLLERTTALRGLVSRETKRCSVPTIALRSPWIAAGRGHESGKVIARHTQVLGPSSMHWSLMVKKHNASCPEHRKVPEGMTPSDWRHIDVPPP